MAKGVATTLGFTCCYSQSNAKIFQVNPTIAPGDFKYFDPSDSTYKNLATLPDVYPAGGSRVRFQFSAAEFSIEPLEILGKDAAGDEWCDVSIFILPSQIPPVDPPPNSSGVDTMLTNYSTLTAAQVWNTLISSLATPSSIGAWILDKLDVKVSSISSGPIPTAAQIWNYAWRTLTTNNGQVVIEENTVQVNTYDTLYLPIENLGSFNNYVAIYVTVKQSKKDKDNQAILQLRKRADSIGDGLLVALGQPATVGDGSITILDASLGNIVVSVKDSIMGQIQTGDYVADVKIIRSAGVLSEVLRNIKFVVVDTVTKAIS